MIQEAPDMVAALEEQEKRIRFASFDHNDAWHLGVQIIELARARQLTITASVRLGMQVAFQGALPGTNAGMDHWMNRKVAVVKRYDASSLLVATRLSRAGISASGATMGVDPAGFAFNGGAFPIRVGATQVGVVVASGVNDFVEHDIIVEALQQQL